MKITELDITGLVVIEPTVFEDFRGYFFESYSDKYYNYEDAIPDIQYGYDIDGKLFTEVIPYKFVQDNESYSKAGTLRGLHWQNEPYAQAKLVRVIKGKIFDVAVDLRKNSPTFGKWYGVELSGDNKKQFFIPTGFAHGFLALEDTIFAYKCSNIYDKSSEGGLIWNDPTININWPVDLVNGKLIISDKDKLHKTFDEQFKNV